LYIQHFIAKVNERDFFYQKKTPPEGGFSRHGDGLVLRCASQPVDIAVGRDCRQIVYPVAARANCEPREAKLDFKTNESVSRCEDDPPFDSGNAFDDLF
jgi:hypothetical protein